MNYWLMKSEPSTYSIDDLEKDGKTFWDGVRNYQARNFMRDQMKIEDLVLFYHSNGTPPGVTGIAKVCSKPHADLTALDAKSKYYDPKATKENPRWVMIDIAFVKKFHRIVSLPEIRKTSSLKEMLLLKKGMRLSIQPIEKKDFELIKKMGSNGS